MPLRSFADGPFLFTPLMLFPDMTGANLDTALLFLAWAELFGEKTPDTYRAKLHDTLSLIIELEEVASQAETDPRWMRHLPHVFEELKAEAQRDSVLELHFPHLKDAIDSIDKGVSRARAARFADAARNELETYQQKVSAHFEQSLSALPKAKENVLSAVRRVATRAVQQGLSPNECRDCLDESVLASDPATVGNQLLSRLVRKTQQWFCIIAIAGNRDEVATLLHGTPFKQLPNRLKPLGKEGARFLSRTENAWLAFTEVEAAGRNEALQLLLQPLRLVLDVANFNHRSAPFHLKPYVFLKVDDRQYLIELDEQSNSGLKPQRDATDLAARMQREGVLSRLPGTIVTALEQHSVAHASTDPKVRFVNIWVALETLVGQDQESSIVDNLIRNIVPHVVHRRINKIIRYLAICLHEYGFCRSVSDETGWFRNSTAQRVEGDELLMALTKATDSSIRNKLAALTANHPLLCNRLFTVHKSVFDPNVLHKETLESVKRTEWQLRRIYRARNLLVHSGSPVTSLGYLATNLEYYFSLTLARVLHDFSRYPQWSLERSFEYRRIQFEYLLRQLERSPSSITVSHFLQQESPHGTAFLWPAELSG